MCLSWCRLGYSVCVLFIVSQHFNEHTCRAPAILDDTSRIILGSGYKVLIVIYGLQSNIGVQTEISQSQANNMIELGLLNESVRGESLMPLLGNHLQQENMHLLIHIEPSQSNQLLQIDVPLEHSKHGWQDSPWMAVEALQDQGL